MSKLLNLRKLLFVGLILPYVTLSYSCWNSSSSSKGNQSVNRDSIYAEQHIEEDVVSLVEQTDLYINEIKLNGYHQRINVSLMDSVHNIYLVKLTEDIGDSSKMIGNFLVDANRMVILNPDGKIAK